MDAEPDLLIGGERIEMDLAVIAQSIQIIEKRRPAVPILTARIPEGFRGGAMSIPNFAAAARTA